MAQTLRVQIIGDTKSYEAALGKATSATTHFGRSVAKGFGIAAAGVAAVGVASVKMADNFETTMAKIVGLAGVSKKQTDAWGQSLLKLGPAVGKGPQELADALYEIASSGVSTSKAMDVLTVSAKASSAGLGETKTVADAVTSVMNAYGEKNISAAQATDVLIAAVREGKGEADAFAPVIGNVAGFAAQLGVKFSDVGAALAGMTRLGTDARTSSVQLTAVFSTLAKGSKQTEKGLQDVGLSTAGLRQELKEKGLLATLDTLKQAFHGNVAEMAKAFPNVRALRGVLALTGASADSVAGIFNRMKDSTGSLSKAFDAVSKTGAFKFHQTMGALQSVGITFGAMLQPLAYKLSQLALTGLTDVQNALDKISKAKGFTAKIGVAFDIAKDALDAVRAKIEHLLFGGVAFGAGGVGPQGIKIDQGIVSKIGDAFAKLDWTATGKSIIDGIVNALKTAGELAKTLADTVMKAVHKINWEGVGRVMGPGLAAAIASAFTTLMDPSFWVRNWDLALSIALVAFSGPIGKIAGKLAPLLGKVGGDLVLGIAGGIEKFAPKLAEVFLAGMDVLGRVAVAGARKVAELVGAGLGVLEGIVRGIFGRLGGLAVLAIKVLGINAAIDAIAQFAVKVGGFFADLGRSIAGFFEDAWAGIKRGALVAALAVVEPFSHLPSKLGGWARSAKDSMQAELSKIDAAAAAQKLVNQMDDKAGAMRTAGAKLAASLAKGVTDGLAGQLLTVGKSIASFIASAGAYARKNTGSTTEEYAAKILGKPIGQGTIAGVESTEKLLGASLVKLIRASLSKGAAAANDGADIGGAISSSVVKGMGDAAPAIIAAAKKVGVDARAALAVAMSEGGTKFGAVGDQGTSFGPFQLHIGGANPYGDPKKAAEFANSINGITYALKQMASAGASGKTGYDAITAIVRNFERPADPSGEIRRAIEYYKQLPAEVGSAAIAVAAKTGATIKATIAGLTALVKQYAPQIGLEQARSLVQGVVDGLNEKQPTLVQQVRAKFTEAVNLKALVQQYSKQLGADHVQAIIDGLTEKQPTLVQQAQAAIREVIAKQKQAVVDAKAAFSSAFGELANAALAAFDKKMADWKPPSGVLLDAFKLQDQIGQMTEGLGPAVNAAEQRLAAAFSSGNKQAIDQAQNDLNAALTNSFNAVDANTMNMLNAAQATLAQAQAEGDPDKIATAQAAYDQALTDRTAALNQNQIDQRALIEQNLQWRADAEQRTHDAIAAKQREGLAKQLYELQQWLLKHPAQWAQMGAKVQAVLTKYNVQLKDAGTAWADKFGQGITAGIPAAVKAAHALAAAVAAVLPSKNSPLQPAQRGPLAFHPYDMGKDWATALGSGLTAGRLPTTMAGMAAAPGGLAFAGGSGGGGAAVVNVYVSGTVVSENQLVDAVYRGLVRKSGRNSGNLGLS